MDLPALDHVGWGRLLAAVAQSDPSAATEVVERDNDTSVDPERLRRRADAARTVVLDGHPDVYA